MKPPEKTPLVAPAAAGRSARGSASQARAISSALAPAEPAFLALFDSSGEALLVLDPRGAIQRANRRAQELLGLAAEQTHGQGLENLLRGPRAKELSRFWSRGGAPLPRSLESPLRGGSPVRVTLRAILPGSGHLLVCVEEARVERPADARGHEAEAVLRGLAESLEEGVLLLGPSGAVRIVNSRFEELFGLRAGELETARNMKDLAALLSARLRHPGGFDAPWQHRLAGKSQAGRDELELLRPVRRIVERHYRPLAAPGGRAAGWLELFAEVTGERPIPPIFVQTEKMAALGQLVSGIAHELNNPLTAIMGYTQLLLGHGLMPAQHAEASKVYQEAERARRIVKNLLYFARQNQPERSRADLNEIIERTLALRSYELRVENIEAQCDLDPALPLTMADPTQLQQVVLNLLVNAEQALLEGRGQGHVWIRTRYVPGAQRGAPGGRIVLEVSDDGPGVPPAIASRIFDPFFTTKPPGVGTGLGLSIVYGIVQQHGGEVSLESPPGGGARFVVELPVVAVPADARAVSALAPTERPGTVPPARILVIEDEPSVAQLIADVLREEGHQAEAVLDSQEGLTRLSRSRYDLVVCDLRMPVLDGEAVYHALRGAGSPLRNRILFVTGDVLAPKTLDFLERNGLPYLTKPFLVEELKLAVNRLLEPALPSKAHAGRARAAPHPGQGAEGGSPAAEGEGQ